MWHLRSREVWLRVQGRSGAWAQPSLVLFLSFSSLVFFLLSCHMHLLLFPPSLPFFFLSLCSLSRVCCCLSKRKGRQIGTQHVHLWAKRSKGSHEKKKKREASLSVEFGTRDSYRRGSLEWKASLLFTSSYCCLVPWYQDCVLAALVAHVNSTAIRRQDQSIGSSLDIFTADKSGFASFGLSPIWLALNN